MKKIGLALSIFLLAATATGCAGANMTMMGAAVTGPGAALVNQGQAADHTDTKQDTAKTVSVADDDIRSGSFKVDGVTYKLPVNCRDFIKQGWELDPAHHNTQLAPGNSLHTELKKGSAVLNVTIGNAGDVKNPVTDLTVISIMFFVQRPDNSPMVVELPKGIVLTIDSLSDIIAAHGEADYVGASGPGNPYAKDIYSYWTDSRSGIRVDINVADNGWNPIRHVTVSNEVAFEQKQDALRAAGSPIAEPSKEVAAYQVPTSLGTDITSGVIEFEGDLYTLPVPISAMQKNGWKLHVDFPSELEPGGYQMVYLSRGEKEISQYIVNLGTETAVHSNCFADRWNTGEGIQVAGLKIGDSRENVLEVIAGLDYEYDPDCFSDSDMYLVKLGHSDDSVHITVSDVTNQVDRISIKKEELHK